MGSSRGKPVDSPTRFWKRRTRRRRRRYNGWLAEFASHPPTKLSHRERSIAPAFHCAWSEFLEFCPLLIRRHL